MKRLSRHTLTIGLAAGALAVAAAGCNDSTGPTRRSAVGLYALQTVNGNALPYTFSTGGGVTETITSDRYTLNGDYTYTEVTRIQFSDGTTTTASEAGNWAQNYNALSFQPTSSSSNNFSAYTASLTGGGVLGGGLTMTIGVNGVVEVYTMQ